MFSVFDSAKSSKMKIRNSQYRYKILCCSVTKLSKLMTEDCADTSSVRATLFEGLNNQVKQRDFTYYN